MSFNRRASTVRFNLAEQHDLREMCKFWGMNEQRVLKLAFQQLVRATKEIHEKSKVGEDVPSTSSQEQESSEQESQSSESLAEQAG